jgi:hypothetical protein
LADIDVDGEQRLQFLHTPTAADTVKTMCGESYVKILQEIPLADKLFGGKEYRMFQKIFVMN